MTSLKEKRKKDLFKTFKDQAFLEGEHIARQRGGQTRGWIFDVRSFILNSQNADLIFDNFWDVYKDKYPFQVTGETLAGALTAQLLSLKAKEKGFDVNCFLVREERKITGLQKKVEGIIKEKIPIVIIDDLFNTGATISYLMTILKENNCKVDSSFVFVDYETDRGKKFLKENKLKLKSFFKLTDFEVIPSKPFLNRQQIQYNPVWNFKPLNSSLCYPVPKSTPCQDKDTLYLGTDSGVFYALNKKDGSIKWKFKTGKHIQNKGIFSCPVILNDTVYFGAYDGNLYALDTKTGEEKWKFYEADWIGSSPCISEKHDLVFIGLEFGLEGTRGGVVVLNAKTGEKIWEDFFEDYVHCSPVYSKALDVVIIGSNCGYVRLYDAKTGEIFWENKIGFAVKSSFVFDDEKGVVCFGAFDGKEYVLSITTGKILFIYQTQGLIYSTPIIKDGKLYFTSTDKNIYIFNFETKQLEQKLLTSGKILSTPVSWKNYIVFGSNDGKVYFVNFEKNKIKYIQFTERITNKIVFDKSHCYVSLYNNEVCCIDLKYIKNK